ncbi:hypothetical protein F3Y22_tig00112347pilonHSYRG00122 [Hibiscus syriacus]|uniref:Reverse transcriptase zinc-binding domain-containing protein n=1 Tax=Hibiscus syriacus TaxID=106335 RepID=A0A6A2YB46_HIBSY|nr:hypothetical protein F3Y22_tig00112347pilonHSYRG00122 [Hibiscus syriacus]
MNLFSRTLVLRSFWNQVLTPMQVSAFFNNDLLRWLFRNQQNLQLSSFVSTPWATLFATLLWRIWKRRNEFVFKDSCPGMSDVLSFSLVWSSHFASIRSPNIAATTRQTYPIRWKHPKKNWRCLNMDVSVDWLLALVLLEGSTFK